MQLSESLFVVGGGANMRGLGKLLFSLLSAVLLAAVADDVNATY